MQLRCPKNMAANSRGHATRCRVASAGATQITYHSGLYFTPEDVSRSSSLFVLRKLVAST